MIQQRIALDRERAIGLWLSIAGGLFLLLGGFAAMAAPERLSWVSLVMPAILLLLGLFRLWAYGHGRRVFEEEHGPDAGMQRPVGR